GLWFSIAAIHLPALASKHIGSGPGVVGESGMQVQPFVPLRTSVILPLASAVTIDAFFASDAGAADSALATGSAGAALLAAAVSSPLAFASLVVAALLQPAMARAAAPVANRTPSLDTVMSPSFRVGRTSRLSQFIGRRI